MFIYLQIIFSQVQANSISTKLHTTQTIHYHAQNLYN